MFYVYVLQSLIDNDYLYKGHCEDVDKRLIQHNLGMTISIKHKLPFKIIFAETFPNREEAILRERYFKTAAGRRFLKNKLKETFRH